MIILGIESSCDDTSAAIIKNGEILVNITATQAIHESYGGVVPELASRAHQKHILPVVHQALEKAGIKREDLSAIAFSKGPGLLGSLLVGTSFAKGMAMSLNIPIIEVNHMVGHILAHFIREPNEEKKTPEFPFLCLTVSGGHTQIVKVTDYFDMEIIGETIDDAAGEAFDKSAKIMGLPYPGGPLIDRYAQEGDPNRFAFTIPSVQGFNYSFSGLKTQFLYFIQRESKENPNFIADNRNDICASWQAHLIKYLLSKFKKAAKQHNIKQIAIAGGVSANSGLRKALSELSIKERWSIYVPEFEYCTDNAGMIAMTGYFKYLKEDFAPLDIVPSARMGI
ncbi:MAG: tRNA (adenosine(37)-N6)-threonylcarbamoyltransferase complex transferase subunit TsaD [Flavobacteriales bacterium]|nr:tRNA (adenosine(37)-N6)-threonylcarbamoyltransferase complex transferase subunit TsaD [Flavobacteriales bacterium]